MAQYNLRLLPSHDYAAMHAGDELDENEKFHDSFAFPQETAPPSTSAGNPSGQFSTPLVQNRGPTGSQDDIAELTAAIAQAKVKNDELEHCGKVTKLKAKLHALRKRNAHLQSQTARVEAVSTVPTGGAAAREPSVTINQLHADPVLPRRFPLKLIGLGSLRVIRNMRASRPTPRNTPEVRNCGQERLQNLLVE